MDTTRDVLPSGAEVESAAFHPDVRSRIRGELDGVKRSLAHAKSSMRDGARSQVTKVQSSMKNSPMLWAGIAAGTGFGLGLIGRFIHWRNDHRRHMPQLVIIEHAC